MNASDPSCHFITEMLRLLYLYSISLMLKVLKELTIGLANFNPKYKQKEFYYVYFIMNLGIVGNKKDLVEERRVSKE